MLFHSLEQRGTVIQVHAGLSSAAGPAFGQPDRQSSRRLLRAAQDQLKTFLDQRSQRRATTYGLLLGSFEKFLIQPDSGAHMSNHTASYVYMSIRPWAVG